MNRETTTSHVQMPVRAALQGLLEAREASTIVVTHQGSARVVPLLSKHPLDFHYNPSTMGGAIPFGLGLALASPARQVIAISGDGSLAMSLGCLMTVVATGVSNLTVVVLDNGMYEVTGGQKIPADGAKTDYVGLAKSLGFASAFRFAQELPWRQQASQVLTAPGPRLICLCVEPTVPGDLSTPAANISEQLRRLSQQLRRTE